LAAAVLLLIAQSAHGQGIIPPGAGPILRSFGGTAIAAPLDTIGSLYWNPATLSFLDKRIDIGAEFIWKDQTIESTIPANLLGPGMPPMSVTGKTASDDGMQIAPATGMLVRFEGKTLSNLSLSAGAFAYSGSGTNYRADPKNPTLLGLGGWFNSFVIIAFPIGAAYKIGDHLSIGLAVDIATTTWQWSRAIFSPPEMATVNGMNVIQYPPAIASSSKYGAGVHAGGYYHFDFGLGLGLMIKSPIWFQDINYNTTTLAGAPQKVSVSVNTPLFVGAGLSFDGLKKWLFAFDFKYAVYKDIAGFYSQSATFQPNGTVNGLGYDNGLAVTFGIQFKPIDKLALRVGYKYSTQIVPNMPTFEISAGSLRHAIGGGISFDVTNVIALHAAFVGSWAIPVEGEMTNPLTNQPIPGSNIRLGLVEYAPSLAISFKY
jgi:long-subunit fatty acid transport protein